jgi:ubiquinone/menaquinone biosynthesis C-methylase UbiE
MDQNAYQGKLFKISYDSKNRFNSYWHQINEIISLKPKNVLEIGGGNNFVAEYLKKKNLIVTTLDFEPKLKPDVVSSVLSMPFPSNSFDVVSCCEVLEHLPYENFGEALSEIYRVCNKFVVLSLPDRSGVFCFYLQISKIIKKRKLITLPSLKKSSKFTTNFWEIGAEGYPVKMIINDIKNKGFSIENSYRVFEYPKHRFFILKK